MAAKKQHRVTAAQIVVKIPGAPGGEAYLRRGRHLPEAVEVEELKRLLSLGLIEEARDTGTSAAGSRARPTKDESGTPPSTPPDSTPTAT